VGTLSESVNVSVSASANSSGDAVLVLVVVPEVADRQVAGFPCGRHRHFHPKVKVTIGESRLTKVFEVGCYLCYSR
jgi:hypothetical protein